MLAFLNYKTVYMKMQSFVVILSGLEYDRRKKRTEKEMFPQEFTDRMKKMLGHEYDDFMKSYERERYYGLRFNPLKGNEEAFFKYQTCTLSKIPWAKNGYYYNGEKEHPGKHPFHEAGVYYIQEPSAMAPAGYLDAKAGEKILDLCAAPGGKTTMIAAAMEGKGLLVSNEIHPTRAKILSENVERMGIRNAIVTNETPQKLAKKFPEFFDKIMVDAPCSGEGMFVKNEIAKEEWSLENIVLCAERQDEILDCAFTMLKPGGRIVYSTCTFSEEEDEGSVLRFLERHEEMEIEKVARYDMMSEGICHSEEEKAKRIQDTIRLWPHKLKGEGHYLAVLKKKEEVFEKNETRKEQKGEDKKNLTEFLEFQKAYLKEKLSGIFVLFGEQLYLLPEGTPDLKGLKVLRAGMHLGTMKKKRFEPGHALALALKSESVLHSVTLHLSESEIYQYLEGNTFSWEGEKGWYLITIEGYSIGWGKLVNNMMKNHYPKGLRKKINP